jgi:hypothetical protein
MARADVAARPLVRLIRLAGDVPADDGNEAEILSRPADGVRLIELTSASDIALLRKEKMINAEHVVAVRDGRC